MTKIMNDRLYNAAAAILRAEGRQDLTFDADEILDVALEYADIDQARDDREVDERLVLAFAENAIVEERYLAVSGLTDSSGDRMHLGDSPTEAIEQVAVAPAPDWVLVADLETGDTTFCTCSWLAVGLNDDEEGSDFRRRVVASA